MYLFKGTMHGAIAMASLLSQTHKHKHISINMTEEFNTVIRMYSYCAVIILFQSVPVHQLSRLAL